MQANRKFIRIYKPIAVLPNDKRVANGDKSHMDERFPAGDLDDFIFQDEPVKVHSEK